METYVGTVTASITQGWQQDTYLHDTSVMVCLPQLLAQLIQLLLKVRNALSLILDFLGLLLHLCVFGCQTLQGITKVLLRFIESLKRSMQQGTSS